MLKRVKIEGYKSLQDVEVRFEPLSVLFGPNASGKSNLMDALLLLSKMATCQTLKEAFSPPYRGKPLESFTFPAGGIRGLLDCEKACFSIEVDVELSPTVVADVNRQIQEMKQSIPETEEGPDTSSATADGTTEEPKKIPTIRERRLRYRIEVEILPKTGILRVADEYLAALNNNGEPTGRRTPFLSLVNNRLHLRMEGQAHPTYFERRLDHSVLSMPHYPPHYPHLVAMRRELESWHFFYFEPREIMRASNAVREVRHVGHMGEELAAFLNTLKALDPAQFRAVQKALRLLIPGVEGIDVDVNDLGEVELRLNEQGISMPARLLSEGTLRLIGLLALTGAKEPPALIGFEEPENGVHPSRVRLIADLLVNRVSMNETQFIVTTHSPVLLDLIPPNALYVCRRSEGRTSIMSFPDTIPLMRRNRIAEHLDGDEDLKVSTRVLRGDYDA
jgi:predicted ATPase